MRKLNLRKDGKSPKIRWLSGDKGRTEIKAVSLQTNILNSYTPPSVHKTMKLSIIIQGGGAPFLLSSKVRKHRGWNLQIISDFSCGRLGNQEMGKQCGRCTVAPVIKHLLGALCYPVWLTIKQRFETKKHGFRNIIQSQKLIISQKEISRRDLSSPLS